MLVGVRVHQPGRSQRQHGHVTAHLHARIENGVVMDDESGYRFGPERRGDRIGHQTWVIAAVHRSGTLWSLVPGCPELVLLWTAGSRGVDCASPLRKRAISPRRRTNS